MPQGPPALDSTIDQSRVVVVLVRARNPSNIGAVARAMHDLGFAHLRIVNDFPVPFAAAKSAVDASSVLAAATEPASVAEAVADCTLVLGTTAVGERALQHPLQTLNQAAATVRQTLRTDPAAKIALLFGSEKTGLSNEELSHCHALLTIPMNTLTADHHLSMNLGQAAAVCLYQLALGDETLTPPAPPTETPAAAADLERLTSLLQQVLDDSGYTRRHPANSREPNVRRLVRRMALSADDAPVWTGILRQLLHALKPGSEKP
ncbi:RNA methyltransferase [Granulicella tundricola]|uniref:tRNA/rRNA methyltransferase (SpoU) n=1 Tax=Granulicella tundricola (strain ATCC BAA-1859 / DSM 23138 / MP5ACTX9) TaxID=1198114 RepID=E8WW63_GRATM|nr:TrmH family RNA methyltransferase [Granulicella tundricola]ADW67369.1 tRNA/rRNA methyltransferase (SpoU) [Granulicella tundricola MP5ACTX9]